MSSPRGNALIGQSGGPTCVINQSLVGVIETAREASEIDNVYGTVHGIQGILDVFTEETARQKTALEGLERLGVPFLPGDAFDPQNMDVLEMMNQVGYF